MRRWAESGGAGANQSGFTLLELVIVIVLVILLFLSAWWRLMPLRGSAEAAHVAATVGTLRSALGMHVAERIVTDSLGAVAELDDANPMRLLERPPATYIGEVETNGAEIAPGSWYFESSAGRLGYRVRHPQYLVEAAQAPVDLYWGVRVRRGGQSDSIRAVVLEPLHDRRWQPFDAEAEVTDPQP